MIARIDQNFDRYRMQNYKLEREVTASRIFFVKAIRGENKKKKKKKKNKASLHCSQGSFSLAKTIISATISLPFEISGKLPLFFLEN